MKKIFIILVLLLIGFSHPLLSKNLPTSLFGITLLDKVDEYFRDKEVNEPNIFNMHGRNFYYYYEETINFTKNSDFSEYFITTNKDGIINGIGASKKIDSCKNEQDKLIEVYSTLYDIKKEDFMNKLLRGFDEDQGILYIDRSFLNIRDGYKFVLSFECEKTTYENRLYVLLSTIQVSINWDYVLNVLNVSSINLDLLNKHFNFAGFGINKFPVSLFGFTIFDSIEKYLDPENFSTEYFNVFLDEYPSYLINNTNYQRTKMIYNDSFERYLILLNNEKKIVEVNAFYKIQEINFDNFENDACKIKKNYLINILSDLFLIKKYRFKNEY